MNNYKHLSYMWYVNPKDDLASEHQFSPSGVVKIEQVA